MRAHLHLLGILQRVWGGLLLTLGASTAFLALGAGAIGWTAHDRAMSAALTSLAFGIFAAALLAGGVVNGWAGRALAGRHARARSVTITLAVPNLFVLPFGTALGVYALWVLLHNETRGLFEAAP